jgi:serine/threonine protein kinase
MAEMAPGTEFGGYRIERLLGSGGFCNVYLAEDLRPALRRKVALKVLNPTLSADDKNRERFQPESLLAVELDDHPNIVGVLDAGEQDGQLYIAQRYIEGTDLGTRIETGGPMAPERMGEVITEIGSALDAAHEAGLVHRDVKPRNILIRERDDRCFLADFGLTKRTASSDSLTGAGEFLGTFAYAAPEQLGGEAVDGRADLYALGCVLYEGLTGSPPFSGDIHSMITAHLTKPPPPASGARADLPPAVDAVITKAMAKDPADRYQTGRELAEATSRALRSSGLPPPVVAPPPPPPTETVSVPAPPAAAPPPPTTPVPGPLPTPGPAPTPAPSGDGRSKVPLLIAGAALLVVLVVGGLLLLGGGGDDSSDDGQVDRSRQTDPEEQAAEDLLEALPAGFERVCEPADAAEGAVATVTCEPPTGADDVSVSSFEDADARDEDFTLTLGDASEEPDPEGECQTDRFATHSWRSDSGEVTGQVACFLDDAGEAVLIWTDDEHDFVATAHRSDDQDGTLYNWWADLVDRAPPDDGEEPFPNALEEELLDHVPDRFADTCVRAELREAETASVQCTPNNGASTVFYSQYETATAVVAQYEALLQSAGVEHNTGQSNECPFENALIINETRTGRVFCAMDEDGDPYMVWTNRQVQILSEASVAPGTDVAGFWEWWTTAGPIL